MVRKSILIYDLLRTEQPQDGFSEKEIVEQISNKHDIVAGKGLRRQVAVALRRGIDFGILAKSNNKFRFDPDVAKSSMVSTAKAPSRNSQVRKKKPVKKTKKTKQRPKATNNQNRKRNPPVPQPRMPKVWSPNRRNLIEEPVPKVKKV